MFCAADYEDRCCSNVVPAVKYLYRCTFGFCSCKSLCCLPPCSSWVDERADKSFQLISKMC